MYRYVFKTQALKDFGKLSERDRRRVIKKLDFYISSNDPLVFAKRMINYDIGHYRYRVGNYRIIFDIKGSKIVVLSLGHHKDIYR